MDWYALRVVSWWSGVMGTGITFVVGLLASLLFPPPGPDKLYHDGVPLTLYGTPRRPASSADERKSLLDPLNSSVN